MAAPENIDGYTVAYEREELQFPVYVVMLAGLGLLAFAFMKGSLLAFPFGAVALGYAYYNFPLLETGQPRIGAGQYGMFIEGLGVLPWRAIEDIRIVGLPARGIEYHELHIVLSTDLDRALLADWRKRPLLRFVMRLPWKADQRCIRIPLEILDRPGGEIHATFTRMWQYFRS